MIALSGSVIIFTSVAGDAANVAALSGCTHCICGRRCVFSGVLPRKLLKSNGGCWWLVLPKCGDLFCTLYLLKFPTNKSQDIKSEERSGHRTRPITRPSKPYRIAPIPSRSVRAMLGTRCWRAYLTLRKLSQHWMVDRKIQNQQQTRRFMKPGRYRQRLNPQVSKHCEEVSDGRGGWSQLPVT